DERLTSSPSSSPRYEADHLEPTPPSIRRRGGGMLARLAFVFSLLALFLVLFRDPLGPIYRLKWNAFGSGLESYDFSSPSASLKSQLEMEVNNDFRAAIEFSRRLGHKRVKEKLDTLEIKKEVEVKVPEKRRGKADAKTESNTRAVKLLFVS